MSETQPQPIELRSAQTVGVRWKDRVIEVIAVPYEIEALVPHRGKMIRELFARGSFESIAGRPNRVKVHRDHPVPDPSYVSRPVGRAVALHPSRTEGLVAELGISNTVLGDETLALAEDGVLDASVGFAVMPGGDEWLEQRAVRRVTKAYLDHIAMVPDPAYAEARVLAVRTARGGGEDAPRLPTPNLDRWRLDQLVGGFSGAL